ncbi:DNA-binding response regulator [Chromobacterium sp. Rain0013]|nr:DNA-binding response regulator [Chromobacterium sp. Rain0013]
MEASLLMKANNTKWKLAVADDHPVVLSAMIDAFNSTQEFEVCLTANSGNELLKGLESINCNMIITDFSMPSEDGSEDGLRLIDRIKRKFPTTPIVIFTMINSNGIINYLTKTQVAGVVGKSEELDTLINVCKTAISSKKTVLSPKLNELVRKQARNSKVLNQKNKLSAKELEVVRLYCQGISLVEIARMLNRAVGTIGTQKQSAMHKLQIDNNVELIAYAKESGLIQ